MEKVNYVRMAPTSRDITIIRQHFANDEVMDYLWDAWQDEQRGKDDSSSSTGVIETESFEDAVKKVDAYLWRMVELTMSDPPEELIRKITGDNTYVSPVMKQVLKLEKEKKERDKDEKFREKMDQLSEPPF